MIGRINRPVLILVIAVMAITNGVVYNKYREYKQAEARMYASLENRFVQIGLRSPLDYITRVVEGLDDGSMTQDYMKTWLLQIAEGLYVGEQSSMIATGHWSMTEQGHPRRDPSDIINFYGALRMNILDIVRTENDYEAWRTACYDLRDILAYMNQHLDEAIIKEGNYKEVTDHWHELMLAIHEKHSDSRVIQSYFFMNDPRE